MKQHAVKARPLRATRRRRKRADDSLDVGRRHRPGLDVAQVPIEGGRVRYVDIRPGGHHRTGRHRLRAARGARVRQPPAVPQLHHDPATGRVNGVHYAPPGGFLRVVTQAGHAPVTTRRPHVHHRGLSEDQPGAGRCAGGVIARHIRAGHAGIAAERARHRRHHHPVGHGQTANVDRFEQCTGCVHGHDLVSVSRKCGIRGTGLPDDSPRACRATKSARIVGKSGRQP